MILTPFVKGQHLDFFWWIPMAPIPQFPWRSEDYLTLSEEFDKLKDQPPVVIEKEDKRATFLEEPLHRFFWWTTTSVYTVLKFNIAPRKYSWTTILAFWDVNFLGC